MSGLGGGGASAKVAGAIAPRWLGAKPTIGSRFLP
eukprot:SAG22_NODE_21197_length_259_cov_0.643750_1_plen_34_part_01